MNKEEKIDAILEKIDDSKKEEIDTILNSDILVRNPSVIDEYFQISQNNELGEFLPELLYSKIKGDSLGMEGEDLTTMMKILEAIREEESQQSESVASDEQDVHVQATSTKEEKIDVILEKIDDSNKNEIREILENHARSLSDLHSSRPK